MDRIVYFNGEFIPDAEATVHVSERGLTKGDAVFDAARTFGGEPYLLGEHIDRLFRSLEATDINSQHTAAEIDNLTREVVSKNSHELSSAGDFQIMQIVTRGQGPLPHLAVDPTVYIRAAPITFGLFAPLYTRGIEATLSSYQSFTEKSLDPRIKTFNRMNFNLAEVEAQRKAPGSWPILTDSEGRVSEGTRYNVFAVIEGTLMTPPTGAILEGISRAVVLRIAAGLGIRTSEEHFSPQQLSTAEEVFFTGTSPCMVPVSRLEGELVGIGEPGPIYAAVLNAWGEEVGIDIAEQAHKFG